MPYLFYKIQKPNVLRTKDRSTKNTKPKIGRTKRKKTDIKNGIKPKRKSKSARGPLNKDKILTNNNALGLLCYI